MSLQTANQFNLSPDIAGSLSQGINAGQNIANQFQIGGEKVAAQRARTDEEKNRSLVNAALNVSTMPEQEIIPFLESRISSIEGIGGDASESKRALELAKSGRFEELREGSKRLVNIGVRQGIIKPEAAQEGFTLGQGQTRFDAAGNEIAVGPEMPEGKPQPLQKAEGGMVFNPNTGVFSVDPTAKERLDEIAKIKESGNKEIDAKTRQSISKDITGMIKDTVGIRNTAEDLDRLGSLGSGPASIAMVYKFMKSLDPASVVREGEFATAESAAGVPAQIANFYNKLVKGERLDDAQIESFVLTAKELANSAIDSSNSEINKYLDTFEDSIPNSFIEKTKSRIPARFDVGGKETSKTNRIRFDAQGNIIQ